MNSSGSLMPANAPAAPAQRDAMERAFSMAKRSPKEVDFVELHATGTYHAVTFEADLFLTYHVPGTAQGDPTEANWVGAAFRRKDELLIGSVKGNIG